MSYSFYDWNQAVQQRNEFVENRLRDGSPVVAVAYDDGILMLTLRGTQRKLFEVYDRLMMGALGRQSDIEGVRVAAIESAHKEGFERSPDDVSIQRLVGFQLSPAIRRVYNDQQAIPLTFRGIFAEMQADAQNDHIFVLGYDGEFRTATRIAVAAGTTHAEEQSETFLRDGLDEIRTLDDAIKSALIAWGIGKSQLAPKSAKKDEDEEDDDTATSTPLTGEPPTESAAAEAADESDEAKRLTANREAGAQAIRDALQKDKLNVEVVVLQRTTPRESKFRLLKDSELEGVLADYR